MECDPKKMWTFEQFFETTNSILKKRVVHVFNLAAGSLLHVYINPEQRSVGDVIKSREISIVYMYTRISSLLAGQCVSYISK